LRSEEKIEIADLDDNEQSSPGTLQSPPGRLSPRSAASATLFNAKFCHRIQFSSNVYLLRGIISIIDPGNDYMIYMEPSARASILRIEKVALTHGQDHCMGVMNSSDSKVPGP
jgi:hypothetical protein